MKIISDRSKSNIETERIAFTVLILFNDSMEFRNQEMMRPDSSKDSISKCCIELFRVLIEVGN